MDFAEVIVKYNGEFGELLRRFGASGEDLGQGYGIIVIAYGRIAELAADKQVEYLELPKNLELMQGGTMEESCISPVWDGEFGLSGKGVILGVIDTGIDFTHRDFINEDGVSRILYIWDLSGAEIVEGELNAGAEYDRSYIERYLETGEGALSPYEDSAHGTAVAGVMGGNGRESGGLYKGAAPRGEFVFVKLGAGKPAVSVDIMRGIKYIADKAAELNMPAVINISYGTSSGSHRGSSLFETYIDAVAESGRFVIAAAAGNEGSAGHHFRGRTATGEVLEVPFNVANEIGYIYLSLWKDFADKVSFELVLPDGSSTGIIRYDETIFRGEVGGVNVGVDVGRPTPYTFRQEVYFFAGREGEILPRGVWTLKLYGDEVVDGWFDVWLPVSELVGEETYFLDSDREVTVTLPSTALKALSVGGYDGATGEIADFSGVGFAADDVVKPDIAAPAVGVVAPRVGGGYDSFSGTSIASPIAAGAAALFMEWGLVKGNDPFMYGQRLKAFLRLGAVRREGESYPNGRFGYGRLCLENAVREAAAYRNYDIDLYFANLRKQ